MDEPFTWDQLSALMGELRAKARALLALEGNAQSLQPTELVDSAIRRMAPAGFDWGRATWPNRGYFLGAAHRVMREVLIDHARRRKAMRRPPPRRRVQIEEIHLENLMQTADERPEEVEALFIALDRLREQRPDWAGLTENHYLLGYSWDEAARVMEVSEKTARREGERARVILAREIRKILNEEDITPGGPHGVAADD